MTRFLDIVMVTIVILGAQCALVPDHASAQTGQDLKKEIEKLNQEAIELRKEGEAHWKKAEQYNKWKAELMRRDPYGETAEFRDHVEKSKKLNAEFQEYGERRKSLYARRDALQRQLLQGLLESPKDEKKVAENSVTFDDYAKDEKYEKKDGQTFCSDFVRDVATKRVGKPIPELEGQAKDQFDKMMSATNNFSTSWKRLQFQGDPQKAFENAHSLANKGFIVIAGWKNPNWEKEPKNSGHVAFIVPSSKMATSSAWEGMKVPFIAQAGGYEFENGKTVTSNAQFSYGFGMDKKAGIEIFVFDKPSFP